MHPLAAGINDILEKEYPLALRLLSDRGKRMYFPHTGTLGQSAEAKGKAINATIGIALEDDGSPMHLRALDKVIALSPEQIYPYAPSYGVPAFRSAWQEQIRAKSPSLLEEISLPVVTCGLTHGLFIAAFLFSDPGEEILVPDMHWDNYPLIFGEGAGAHPVTWPMFKEGAYNVEGLQKAMAVGGTGKKIVVLNFPNNPTGYSPTLEEAKRTAGVLVQEAERGSDIVVILDDAYFGFFHTADVCRESLFSTLASAHERILACKIDGPTKEDCCWGVRLGCMTFAGKGASEGALCAMEAKAAGSVRATISNAPSASQYMLAALYRSPEHAAERRRNAEVIHVRYAAAMEALRNPAFGRYLRVLPCNAGYFLCLELCEGMDGEVLRRILLERYDTGVIAFKRLVRIAFSSVPQKRIPELFDNILRACSEYPFS